ncbi:hypothetical protein HY640_01950 [Candidatus Woesearchaeota archaeon]|nr:hypothetical protein [Candidatus Woesearchaeota archaeon]
MTIAYLGPRGTYTEQAATIIAQQAGGIVKLEPRQSLADVATSARNKNSSAVMAYNNATVGTVQGCLDLITQEGLEITGFIRIHIKLYAGIAKGTEKQQHAEIYSHEKALQQATGWIQQNYPHAKWQAVDSTAAAAKKVMDQGTGIAIASEEVMRLYGLKILAHDIGDIKGSRNYTDFLHVKPRSNEDTYFRSHPEGYAVVIAIDSTPQDIGGIIKELTYPKTKILTRPLNLNGRTDQLRCYIEIVVGQGIIGQTDHRKNLEDAIGKVQQTAIRVLVLGTYSLP